MKAVFLGGSAVPAFRHFGATAQDVLFFDARPRPALKRQGDARAPDGGRAPKGPERPGGRKEGSWRDLWKQPWTGLLTQPWKQPKTQPH